MAVACLGRIGDYSTAPPTEPYVKISLIRFLGTARFHTARLSDIAGNPRHPSPSALQHVLSRLSHVPRVPPGTIPSLSRSWAGAADTPPSSDQTLATSSSDRPGDSANTATRASPCGTPDPGTGCYTGCHKTGSPLAASHLDVCFISPAPVPWPVERHARARGHPVPMALVSWIPAFAGIQEAARTGSVFTKWTSRDADCSWRGRWRLSRHPRPHSPRVRRSRLPSVLRLMVYPPRQVVPQ